MRTTFSGRFFRFVVHGLCESFARLIHVAANDTSKHFAIGTIILVIVRRSPWTASLGTHEFWLRGYNAAGAMPWESGDRFYFHVVPPAVNLSTVQITGPISTVPDVAPFVIWEDFPDAATYDGRVYSLSRGVEVARFDNFDGTTFELQELPMADSYSVHLRANTNSGGTTEWSAPFLFQVDEATDDSPIDLSNSLDDLFSGVGSGLIDDLLIGN